MKQVDGVERCLLSEDGDSQWITVFVGLHVPGG